MRKASYDYHRKGLDIMHNEPELGIIVIVNCLSMVESVEKIYPRSMAVQMFTDAKIQELLDVLAAGATGQKKKAYNIMVGVDPYRAEQYLPLNKV